MELWTALGIEKTKDVEKITNAYHEKLKLVPPEEKPEEFMKLRAEYDAAMKYANGDDSEKTSGDIAIDKWMEKVSAVYGDLQRRLDISEWKKLLDDDVCNNLDCAAEAQKELLKFFMEKWRLPQYVFKFLDSRFKFSENKEALYEEFPKEFIDNAIIYGINNDCFPPLELFGKDEHGDPDTYLSLFYKARDEIEKGDAENAVSTVADMEKTGFSHPYIGIVKAELASLKGEHENAVKTAAELVGKYPDDFSVRVVYSDMLRIAGKYHEAAQEYELILEKYPNSCTYLFNLSECYMNTGELEQAQAAIGAVYDILPESQAVEERSMEIAEKLKEYYTKKHADDPADFDAALNYYWTFIRSDKSEEAYEELKKLSPSTIEQKCDYENLMSKLCFNCKKFDETIEHCEKWLKNIEELPEGKTRVEKRRKNKRAETHYIQSLAYYSKNDFDRAIEKAELSKKASTVVYTSPYEICRAIYIQRREFDKAVAEAEKAAEIRPNSYSLFMLGITQYDVGKKLDAYNSFGKVLDYARDAEAYIQRARILCDYEEYDEAQKIVDYLTENDVKDDLVDYIKARIASGNNKSEEALKIYNGIIKNFEDGKRDIGFMWDVYYYVAYASDDEPSEKVMALINKGLELKDYHFGLHDLKAWLLLQDKKYDESLKEYERVLELFPDSYNINKKIALVYFDMGNSAKAFEYYTKQLAVSEDAHTHNMAGVAALYIENYEDAEKHFKASLDCDNEYLYAMTNLGLTYECQFDFERSLPYQEKCVEINDKLKEKYDFCHNNHARTLSRLGRFDEAVKALEKAYEESKSKYDADEIIDIYFRNGKYDECLKRAKEFLKAKVISKSDFYVWACEVNRSREDFKAYLKSAKSITDDAKRVSHIASCYCNSLDYKKATKYFDELFKLSPNSSEYFNDRLLCLRKTGRLDDCEEFYKHALDTVEKLKTRGDEIPLYLTKLGFIHTSAGYPQKAKPFIDRALKAPLCHHCGFSACKDAYSALAFYYEAIGEYDKAIETCYECLKIAPAESDVIAVMRRIRAEHRNKLKKENRK